MELYLKVLKGPLVGQHFQIKEGAKIGRSAADILIADQKISSTHAQIELSQKGEFCLVDLGSSNGLWIDEQRVKKLVLLPGVQFRIGQTLLEVVAEGPLAGHAKDAAPSVPSDEIAQISPGSWRARLAEGIHDLIAENPDPKPEVLPFSPPVIIEFIAGNQTGQKLLLGFGPRNFGSTSLDIEILDSSAPDLAFELVPEHGTAKFISHNKNYVELNGKLLSYEPLKAGDIISFGKTKIKVSFYE